MARGQTIYTNIELEANNDFTDYNNFDNFRDPYLIPIIEINDDGYVKAKEVIYYDINIPIIERFRFYFINNSKRIFLERKYHYRPDYLSYDTYDTVAFAPLLMYLNNIHSVTEFNPKYIYLPSAESVQEFVNIYEQNYGYFKKIKNILYL